MPDGPVDDFGYLSLPAEVQADIEQQVSPAPDRAAQISAHPSYRIGSHYGLHVYEGERAVATFHDAREATLFVEAINERAELLRRVEAAERAGAVKALRAVADEGRRMPLYELRDRADAIENGAPL